MQHRSELPREVHRVAYAGVHALSANGAVDVRRVPEQEHATFSEIIGYTMVDPIG